MTSPNYGVPCVGETAAAEPKPTSHRGPYTFMSQMFDAAESLLGQMPRLGRHCAEHAPREAS